MGTEKKLNVVAVFEEMLRENLKVLFALMLREEIQCKEMTS